MAQIDYCCQECADNDQEAVQTRVLGLNLEHMTQEDQDWLHRLKTLATVMQGRLQMKHLREGL